mmetsp:Transcript_27208/g.35672  ORF Transcript_27208/g.35672 Transcript_27208/m.35672 type:complete len:382 (-) Transcript_27208:9-1154(-)
MEVIEFFAGIGGMRLALPIEIKKITAYEIADAACETYKLNFIDDDMTVSILKKNLVEHIKVGDIDGKADIWTMSPPCQPFTTTHDARKKDSIDPRTRGFKHIMQLLQLMKSPPRFIFLENVKGFEGSDMLQQWKQVLHLKGYTWQQYIISPLQIGIPNNRSRFYMFCEQSQKFAGEEDVVIQHIPGLTVNNRNVNQIIHYLDSDVERIAAQNLIVHDDILAKNWSKGLSIVSPWDRTTYCFTAAYKKKIHKSTGSILFPESSYALATKPLNRDNMLKYSGKLRFFSPKELLNLFGFPSSFAFPVKLSQKHCYKLVGNSINISTVREILKISFLAVVPPLHLKSFPETLLADDIDGKLPTKHQNYQEEEEDLNECKILCIIA